MMIERTSRPSSLWVGATLLTLAGWGCSFPGELQRDPTDAPTSSGKEHTRTSSPASLDSRYAPDSVIVRFKATTGERNRASILSRINGSIKDNNKDGVYDGFANIDKHGNLAKVDLDRTVSVESALELLRRDPSVQYAEPNYLRYISATPNDPDFNQLYGLHNTGQTGGTSDADIDAPEAWDNSVGSNEIVVGVVDTGVDYNHEDLAANIWTNPGEIPGNNFDDEGNGVVDDIHGFNAITGGGDPMDDNNHGTHCAGTIGAVGGNGKGVTGVNWEVSLMAIKFLSAGGSGTTADAIEGINYAVGMKTGHDVNLRVLSNSWGGGGFSQALEDAIEAANDADILFVAAAGNAGSNNDTTPSFPASYETANVVSVAATDHNDGLAPFSNFGLASVDIAAPGFEILSTIRGNTYTKLSGTSMATPHVAGAAALVLSANQTLTTAELKEVLLSSGDVKPQLVDKVLCDCRLNVANALDEAGPPVPRFNLNAGPASRVISQGQSTSYNVDITSVAGFANNVTLTITSQPAINATITASPSNLPTPGTSIVNVATTTATAPGLYTLTITGTSDSLVQTRTVSLRVHLEDTVDTPFPSTCPPIAIPDNNITGINCTLNVQQLIPIQEIQVDLSITHTFIGDLRVTLTSPQGTTVALHNRTGGSADNINQTFAFPSEFTGQQAAGTWVLHVDDNAGLDIGTLNSWTLHVIGVPNPANFAVTATPASQVVTQGQSASIAIVVGSIAGFAGDVALSATSNPPLTATLAFTPASVIAPGISTLNIVTSGVTAPGIYVLNIIGRSGPLSRTTTATLIVRPSIIFSICRPSNDTPIAIPDNNATGITSTVTVADSFFISQLSVEVHITHTYIGDLTVTLIGPGGQSFLLHNRTGGSADNIHQTFSVPATAGLTVAGSWRLKVTDLAGIDIGTLDRWTLCPAGTRVDFSGTLLDPAGLPVAGARVTINGAIRVTSGTGQYAISLPESVTGYHIDIRKNGFSPITDFRLEGKTSRIHQMKTGFTRIVRFSQAGSTPPEIVIEPSSGIRVAIPQNSLRSNSGQPVFGDIRFTIIPHTSQTMPGDFTARRANGTRLALVSVGAVTLQAVDSQNNTLGLVPGATLSVTLPVPPSAGGSMPGCVLARTCSTRMWRFDPVTALWIEQLTILPTFTPTTTQFTISAPSGGGGVIALDDGLGTWNADIEFSNPSCTVIKLDIPSECYSPIGTADPGILVTFTQALTGSGVKTGERTVRQGDGINFLVLYNLRENTLLDLKLTFLSTQPPRLSYCVDNHTLVAETDSDAEITLLPNGGQIKFDTGPAWGGTGHPNDRGSPPDPPKPLDQADADTDNHDCSRVKFSTKL